ncbi:MAG: M1 family metallopeptidase [Candidatus Acidiferrales bacterium]
MLRNVCTSILTIFSALLFAAAPLPAQTAPAHGANNSSSAASHPPLSERVVAYQIDAKLDAANHTIAASESLTYHNLTGQPQQTFPFHLYLNAFQPQSTFMTEVRLNGTRGSNPGSSWDPKHEGSITVSQFEVDGQGDLTDRMKFIQPDDHNRNDHTVFEVTLPKPIAPNAFVTFRMTFVDQLPEVLERTGYKRDFVMVGQWFPKVGVWWKGSWNCHQFHATTEFFADFGTFDVKLTVPQNEVTGAGGKLVSSVDNPDGTKTVTYHSEDVHDFSWTASPHFTDVEDSWTGSAGEVKIHLLMSPGHMASTPRYLHALKGTLKYFDESYGPYPYGRITVVDPPHGGLEAGGMEYPTLITAGTTWWMPKGLLAPEVVVAHEFGHQYWYGMVATNEFEDAWLDEGINSYSEVKVMSLLYGADTSVMKFPYGTFGEAELQRSSYLAVPDTDPITRFAWQFADSNAYGAVTYGKTATVLLSLEKMIGEDTLRRALHTYFMRYRFTHPTGTDFEKTIEEVSGQDLHSYFDQAISGTAILDYEVLDVDADRLNWYEKKSQFSPDSPGQMYHNSVLIHRKGDFIFPVDVQVKFSNGETVLEHWDGRDRWIRYTYDKMAKVVSAEIDPQHQVLLDSDLFNDSRTVKSDTHATRKLGNLWTFANEWLNQILAWLT